MPCASWEDTIVTCHAICTHFYMENQAHDVPDEEGKLHTLPVHAYLKGS